MTKKVNMLDRCEQNKKVAQEFLTAITHGNIDTIEKLLHPELSWWVLGFGESDRAKFIASLLATIALSSERSIEIVGMTAELDRVAVEAIGEFQMPATIYRNSYHYLFIIEAGQIKIGKEYLDTQEAIRVFANRVSQ